jgi:ZIP family zinc transporter
MPTAEGNVGIAFALVCGAGASTALGAAVVFFPSLVKLASRRVLAASLGVSAGVMTYVSFVEIFVKSVVGFAASLVTDDMSDDELLEKENKAFVYASASFFGGVVVMMVRVTPIGRECSGFSAISYVPVLFAFSSLLRVLGC